MALTPWCPAYGAYACVSHHAIPDSLNVEEGDWLVTSLDDDFLCTDVIRETLDGPQSANQSFFAV